MDRWHSLHVAACMIACVTLGVSAAVAESQARDDSQPHLGDGTAGPATLLANETQGRPGASAAYEESQLQSGRLLFWKAYEQFKNGSFTEAVKTFEQVYALMPEPEIQYNIALAHAKNSDCAAAERAFSSYSRVVTSEQKLQQATLSFANVLAQCTLLGKQKATAEPGEPKPKKDESTKDGVSSPQRIKAAKAASHVPLKQAEAAPKVAVYDSASYWTLPRTMGWSFVASAVIASGAAFYFVSRQRGAVSDAEALKRQSEQTNEPANAGDQITDLQRESDRFRLTGSLSALAALGFAAAGTALLVTERDRNSVDPVRLAGGTDLFLAVSGEF